MNLTKKLSGPMSESMNALLAGASFMGIIFFTQNSHTRDQQIVDFVEEKYKGPDKQEVIQQVKIACEHMEQIGDKLPKRDVFGREAQRLLELKGLQVILECSKRLDEDNFDVQDFSNKYGNFCRTVVEGVRKNKWPWHPWLSSFFQTLNDRLCTPEILKKLESDKSNNILNLKQLIEYLKDDQNKNKLQIVRGGKDIKTFCNHILTEVVKSEKDLNTILTYLNKKYENNKGFDVEYPELQKIWDELRGNAEKAGKTLDAYIVVNGTRIGFAQNWLGICGFENVQEIIRKRENSVLPLFLEIVKLLEGDTSADTEEVKNSFLKVFSRIK